MGLTHSPRIATDGLVLCLDAGNVRSYPGSGSTWYDLSGNDNHISLINSPSFTNGTYIRFDGTNQYGYIDISNCSSNFKSMSKWTAIISMQHYNNDSLWHQIMGFKDGDNFVDYWYRNSNKNFRYDGGGGHDYTAVNLTNSGFSVWAHSIEIGTNNSKLYRNGLLGNTYTPTYLNTSATNLGFYIAKQPESTYHSNMSVASIQIYNKVLTAAEIAQNYNATKGRFGL